MYSVPDGREIGRLDGLPVPSGSTRQRNTARSTTRGRAPCSSARWPARSREDRPADAHRAAHDRRTGGDDQQRAPGRSGRDDARRHRLDGGRADRPALGRRSGGSSTATRSVIKGASSAPCSRLSTASYCGDEFGRLEERDLDNGAPTGVRLDPQRGDVRTVVAVDGPVPRSSRSATSPPVVSRWRRDGSGPSHRPARQGTACRAAATAPMAGSTSLGSRRHRGRAAASTSSIWDVEADREVVALGDDPVRGVDRRRAHRRVRSRRARGDDDRGL